MTVDPGSGQEENLHIDVLDDFVDTRITLEDGTRVRLLMSERMVARVVLAYRAALEKLRDSRTDRT